MSYRDTYFKLSWDFINEAGISKADGIITVNIDGCDFTKAMSCPFTLAIIYFMAAHDEESIISGEAMYEQYFEDNRMNRAYFNGIIDILIQEKAIFKVK